MPSPSVKGPFTLKFINCRISRCQGCKGLLRSPGTSSLPLPPHDLIVSRLECRPYMTPDKVERVPKTASNAHYHLRMECLKAADPVFNSRCMSIPEDVKDHSMTHFCQRFILRVNFDLYNTDIFFVCFLACHSSKCKMVISDLVQINFVDISRSWVWFQHATPLKIVRGVSCESSLVLHCL